MAEDQEAAEVQRVVVCQLGKRHQFFLAFYFQTGRVQSWDLRTGLCLLTHLFVHVSLSGLHRRRSAADACVYHWRLTEHRPRRVDVPVLFLNPDALHVRDIDPVDRHPRARSSTFSYRFGGVAAV